MKKQSSRVMPKASFFQKRVLDAVRPVPRYLGESRMSLGRGRHLQYLVYACPAHVDESVLFENTPDFPNYFYWKPLLWHRAYYVGSVGTASLEMVMRYVERQGTKARQDGAIQADDQSDIESD